MYPTHWQLKNRISLYDDLRLERLKLIHGNYGIVGSDCHGCAIGTICMKFLPKSHLKSIYSIIAIDPRIARAYLNDVFPGPIFGEHERQLISAQLGLNYLELNDLQNFWENSTGVKEISRHVARTKGRDKLQYLDYFSSKHIQPYLWMLEIHKPIQIRQYHKPKELIYA